MRSYTTTFIVFFSILLSGVSFGQRREGAKPTVPTIILNTTIDHATCFNDAGCIDYTITTSSGWPKGASVNTMRVYDESNTLVYTHVGSWVTGSVCDLPVGRYQFIGSVTVRNSAGYLVSVPFTFYEWLGIETNWSELKDMVASPNSFSAIRNSLNADYGGVRSSNLINSGDAWIQMNAVYGGSTNSSVYWIVGSEPSLEPFNPNGNIQYIEFYQNTTGSGIRVRYETGSGGYAYSTISGNNSDRIRLVRTGTTLTLQRNKMITNSFTFPVAYSGSMNIIVRTKSVNDGCVDVVSSFTCQSENYAKLERKLRGVKYKAKGDVVRFYVDEEYNNQTGELKYEIYRSTDNVTPVQTNATVSEPIVYGDNRYVLDVSALSTGSYVLEVENDKKEKFYLRFIK